MNSVAVHPSGTVDASPLAGWRIVITRAEDRAEGMVERLRALQAEPIVYPTIAFAPPEDLSPFDTALQRMLAGQYDWLVLTSITAVQAVSERFVQLGYVAAAAPANTVNLTAHVPDLNIAAVGTSTAAACAERLGIQPAVVPEKFVADSLATVLCGAAKDQKQGLHSQRVLLANADIARLKLQEMLQAAGASVDRVIAYRTVPASGGVDLPPLLAAGQIDAITFTSGSSVRYFVQRIGPDAVQYARQTVIACIGPVTADVSQAVGLLPTVVADTFNEAGLVEALVAWAASHAVRET